MNNRQGFSHRANTIVITLSEITQEFSEPERLRLQLSPKVKKKPLDIGSLAYSLRGKNKKFHDDQGVPVVMESFVESRRELIVRLLESFVGQRDTTIASNFYFIEYFLNWLNAKGYKELFISSKIAQQAYREYIEHLKYNIVNKKWTPRTAVNFQQGIIKVVEILCPDDSHHILAGAVKIVAEKGSNPANAYHVELYRDACLAIARQCRSFLLNNKPYPIVVNIGGYEVVGFPSRNGWLGPFKKAVASYNAAERRISTADEYDVACYKLGRKELSKSDVARALASAQANLNSANKDERHWHRLQMAGLAAKAYANLLLLITGATPTEFDQFSHAEALTVEKSPIKNELSAVKFRARGKKTLYNIGRSTGLSLLKEYLELREWILNGVSHDRLFFGMPPVTENLSPIKKFSEFATSDSIFNFYDSISGVFLDPQVPRISPRKMRKHKSIGMHATGVSSSAVAISLNHTEATNQSTYAEAPTEQLEAEFGKFWEAVRHAAQVVRQRGERASERIATGAGHCEGFGFPTLTRDLGAAAIEPNCRTQYGCLYCEHYVCHSDGEDIHKLLSLQFVVDALRKFAPDASHAEALYQELSIRVEFILEALAARSSVVQQLVENFRVKVFEYGELTTFWEVRLSRYEKMGVVF